MKKLSLACLLFFGLAFNQAQAQFEGKINFQGYEINNGEKVKDDEPLTLFITPTRILLQGEQEYAVGGALKAEGIMVRQDEQDFVLLTGEDQAMSITKSGITAFMNMFGGEAQQDMQDVNSNLQIEKSNDQKQINGYTAYKFVITDKQNPETRTEVWMTKELDINWGMLASTWNEHLYGFAGNDVPLELILDKGYFPIRTKQYKNGDLAYVTETEITATNVADSITQIESGTEIISLQDYLFQQFRNNN